MISRLRVTTFAALAAGGLLGWLAGSGSAEAVSSATAASVPPQRQADPSPPRQTVLADAGALTVLAQAAPGQAGATKPNILVIWGDDIGTWNTSFWSRGMMGYQTPARASPSPTTTAGRPAPPAGPRSSAAMCRCAPA